MVCLDNETATAYLRGDLEPEESAQWAAHLAECEACRQRVEDVSALIDDVRRDLMLAYVSPSAIDWECADRVMQGRARGRWLESPSTALRPGFVTAAVVVLLLTIAAVVWWREAPLSAAEVLKRATTAEALTASDRSLVVHRQLTVEERRPGTSEILQRQRVEIVQSTARRVKARRLYDDRGRLLAGEWTGSDGARTVYRAGHAPEIERADARRPINADNAWRAEPSARTFADGLRGTPSLERVGDAYVLTNLTSEGAANDVVHTRLTLAARSLRPIGETLVIRTGVDVREFDFVEIRFETLPSSRVDLTRFEPEPELTAAPLPAISITGLAAAPRVPPMATAAIDVDSADRLAMQAWYRLHALGLTLGGDAFVTRSSAGRVEVDVTVSSELRRTATLERLGPIGDDPRGHINVHVAPNASIDAPAPLDLSATPTYDLLRHHFHSTMGGRAERSPTAASDAVEFVTRESAQWILDESSRIYDRVEALARFDSEWPAERLHRLNLDSRAEWQTIVRDHAVDAGQHAASLRQRAEELLGSASDTSSAIAAAPLNDTNDVRRAIERLLELATRQRTIVRAALLPEKQQPEERESVLDVSGLRQMLNQIESIAARFAGPWTLGR